MKEGDSKKYVVSLDDMRDELNRIYEHRTHQGYFSDYEHKITFSIFDDGVVELMLVDRTHGFHHKVYHFEFKYDEKTGKMEGKRR